MFKLELSLIALVVTLGAVSACGEDAFVGQQRDADNGDGDGDGDGDGEGEGDLSCQGANPQGCSAASPCEQGFVCKAPREGECRSSACDCDAATGTWGCTPDCSGGTCEPEDETHSACDTPNPAGCSDQNRCEPGFECVPAGVKECISSGCSCDVSTGNWNCLPDCGGDKCVPEGEGELCPGLDSTECDSFDRCAEGSVCTNSGVAHCLPEPTACYCDQQSGGWVCPDDCSGTHCQLQETSACADTNNPEGCSENHPCPGNQRCVPSLEPVCISSFCMCNPEGGWDCNEDCNGGVCED